VAFLLHFSIHSIGRLFFSLPQAIILILRYVDPIIAVAGKGEKFVESLIDRSKGDAIVDYREGDEAVVRGIKDALKGQEVKYAYDAVSEKGSFQNISKVLAEEGSKITLVLPGKDYSDIPNNIEHSTTSVGIVFNGDIYKDTDKEEAAIKAGIRTGGREFGLAYILTPWKCYF